jgi:hypothetical protein
VLGSHVWLAVRALEPQTAHLRARRPFSSPQICVCSNIMTAEQAAKYIILKNNL